MNFDINLFINVYPQCLILLFSLLFPLILKIKFNIKILSPFFLFIALNLFYTASLVFFKFNDLDISPIFLGNENSTSKLLVIVSSTIFAFSFSYMLNFKRIKYKSDEDCYKIKFKPIFLMLYLSIFFICIFYAEKYGWQAYTHNESLVQNFKFTLYSYIKYFFVSLALFFFSVSKFSDRSMVCLILLTQTLLFLIDGSRNLYLGFVLSVLFYFYRTVSIKSYKPVQFLALALLLSIGVRAFYIGGNFYSSSIESIVYEGIMGGYSAIQSIHFIDNNGSEFIYGLSYLSDSMLTLLPQEFRAEFNLFLINFSNEIMNSTNEKLSPMGGFFFIGEAYLNFGMLGGLILGYIYGFFLRKVESFSSELDWIYLTFMSTFSLMFVKASFANTIKIFLVYLFFIFVLNSFFKSKISS